jgi:hypothetical protein
MLISLRIESYKVSVHLTLSWQPIRSDERVAILISGFKYTPKPSICYGILLANVFI